MQDKHTPTVSEQQVIIENYPESPKEWSIRDNTKDELKLAAVNPPAPLPASGSTQRADKATQLAIQGIVCAICAAALLPVVTGIQGVAISYSALRWFPILVPAVLLMLSFFSIFRSMRLQNQSASPNKVFLLNGIALLITATMSFYFITRILFFLSPMEHILDNLRLVAFVGSRLRS